MMSEIKIWIPTVDILKKILSMRPKFHHDVTNNLTAKGYLKETPEKYDGIQANWVCFNTIPLWKTRMPS